MRILIIDYGMGNLRSVQRGFEECRANAIISSNPHDIETATHLVLPGVGSYAEAMSCLATKGWESEIKKAVLYQKVPILGICLGMQILSTQGEEGGITKGLNLIPGRVVRMISENKNENIPHVGWNEVHLQFPSQVLSKIQDKTDFYFVHSFHFSVDSPEYAVAKTPYCGQFVSVVVKNNIWGTQFHPEKSSTHGLQILRNFVDFYT